MKPALLLLIVLLLVSPATVLAQDQNPWTEVFQEDGSLRPDLIDLGETTEVPAWMSLDLPFGQSLALPANYHRFQTPEGSIVVLPSAATLFFMAMNPQASGLTQSYGALENGLGQLVGFLGQAAGADLDWDRIQSDHPEYATPEQFWGAVLNGRQEAWTYFSGWSFITHLLQLSWHDAALRSVYLLYLDGAAGCTGVPGGCSGVVTSQPPTRLCPEPTIAIQQPSLRIENVAPTHPLVVGQDEKTRRGADIEIQVSVPPVVFTWHEPVYEEREICRRAEPGETPTCRTGLGLVELDGVIDTETIFKECHPHVERLPDAVSTLQATAALEPASQDWITRQLGGTHYGAFLHQASFNLVPARAPWTGWCEANGTCHAAAFVSRVPFADPGTFILRLDGMTGGTRFMGVPVTQPRELHTDGRLQVYVTLPALVP